MKLDLTKKVQTKGGEPVEIRLTDGRGDYPVLGYIGDDHKLISWTSDGVWRIGAEDSYDLINAPAWHLLDPPEGYEWHRTDWTEEMLPDGWRPLLLGENDDTAEQVEVDGKRSSETIGSYSKAMPHWLHLRTKAPIPPPKPKLREVPLCADDVKAGDEFLAPGGKRWAWSLIHGGIKLGEIWWSFDELKTQGWKIRSIGETEWHKCSRMEEVLA